MAGKVIAKLEDGSLSIERDDGTRYFLNPDGTAVDFQGKRIDFPGAPPSAANVLPVKEPEKFGIEDILPTAGAIAGASLTPEAPPVGVAAGGFLGEEARQAVRTFRGKQEVPTPGEILKRAGTTGAVAGGTEALTGGLLRLGRAALGPPIAQAGLERFAEQQATKFKTPLGIQPTQIGERIGASTKFASEELRRTGGSLQDKVLQEHGTQIASPTSDSKDFIERVLSNRKLEHRPSSQALMGLISKDIEAGSYSADVSSLITQLHNRRTRISKIGSLLETGRQEEARKLGIMGDIMDDLANPNLTYADMKLMRNRVGQEVDFKSTKPEDKLFQHLYKNLTSDMDRTAKEGGFYEAHKEADAAWHDYAKFRDSPEVKAIGKADNPEEIIGKITSSTDTSTIKRLMDKFSARGKDYLRGGFLRQAIDNSKELTTGGKGFEINPSKFRKQLDRPDEFFDALYGKDADLMKSLKDVAESQDIKSLSQITYSPFHLIWKSMRRSLDNFVQPYKTVNILKRRLAGRSAAEIEAARKTIIPSLTGLGTTGRRLVTGVTQAGVGLPLAISSNESP